MPHSMMKELPKVELNKFVVKEQLLRNRRPQTCTVECNGLKTHELKETIKIWRSCKTIQELNLDFEGCHEITDEMFRGICASFKRLGSLKSLGFNLILNRSLFEKGGDYLSESLKRMPTLERLSFCLTAYNNLDGTLLKCLEKGLRELPAFHHLDLKLICNEVSEATFKLFGQFLASLRHLQSLNMHFSSCNNMNSELLASLGEELKASGLRQLNITFEICKGIGKIGLKKLHEKICNISSLKSFRILFKSPGRSLASCLQPLQYVKNLVFELSSSSEWAKKKKSKDLSKVSVETLQLNFENSVNSVEDSQKALGICSTNFKKLKSLTLNLQNGEIPCGMFHFSGYLPNASYEIFPLRADKSLDEENLMDKDEHGKAFYDRFDSAPQVSNNPTNKTLRKLHLNLSNCTNILDVHLLCFREEVRHLLALECLSVDLSSCSYLAFLGFKAFFEGVESLLHLRSLSFNCSKNGIYWKQINEKFDEQPDKLILLLNQLQNNLVSAEFITAEKRSESLELLANSIESVKDFKKKLPCKTQKDMLKLHQKIFNITQVIYKLRYTAFEPYQIEDLNKYMREALSSLEKEQEDWTFGSGCLEKLSLNFEENAIFDDEELEYLSKFIKRSPNLQEIDLNFSKCQGITECGIGHLTEALKALKKLKSLNLDFTSCSRELPSSLASLETDLKQLPIFHLIKP